MLICFWGSRGSIPTPVGYRAVRTKIREALLVARGHQLDSLEAIDNFLAKELPFSISGTYGGNSSCVEIEAGGHEYALLGLGAGVRAFGNALIAKHGPAETSSFNGFLPPTHWAH